MNTPSTAIVHEFSAWADRILSQPVSEATVAFHFNLYEGETSVHIQLIGTDSFETGDDPETDYWPGAETFTSAEEIFEVPFSVAGSDWQQWLETCKEVVGQYIADGTSSGVLRNSLGVGIGFVDGDMHVLWQNGDA